jgi:hypothetical protein
MHGLVHIALEMSFKYLYQWIVFFELHSVKKEVLNRLLLLKELTDRNELRVDRPLEVNLLTILTFRHGCEI